jgi:hypothetical protein
MLLDEFLKLIVALDEPVILLEGKRVVLPEDRDQLSSLGRLLALKLPSCRFRSGNAPGADELFIRGVNEVDPSRVELILPYSGHRSSASQPNYTLALDSISLAAEPQVLYHSELLLGKNLVNAYSEGQRNRITSKASYLIRDTLKVTGSISAGLKKADFALFYDDLTNPGKGGTGHTMIVCRQASVLYADQQVWFSWLSPDACVSNS